MENTAGPGESPDKPDALRLVLQPLFTVIAASCLLVLIGWTGEVGVWQHRVTTLTGVAFALERGRVFWNTMPRGKERVRLASHAVLAGCVMVVSLALILRHAAGAGDGAIGGHVFIQLAVILSGLASMIHHQTRLTARTFHPGIMLMGSFLFIIVCGGLLLKMPRCVVPGATCSWLDAFFTSTSAVCVTGLAVQNTAAFFSHTGQIIILMLIQVGGLGIMTLSFFAAVILFEGLSLHDRLLVGKIIQDNRLSRIGRTLTFVVIMTFVCEGLGAMVLFVSMDGIPEFRERVFHAVFHSISAFCNAGFSTFPNGLADEVAHGNRAWQICIMALIVIGGLGSLVNEDLTNWIVSKVRHRRGSEGPRLRLRVHTRLVLLVTGILIVGGAVAIMVTEYFWWNGPENGGCVITALFHSVTARTAGFNTVPMTRIGPLTVQILMVLMFIGGSPGGTAGGIRTTVVALGLAHLWGQLRMRGGGTVAFNRIIPRETGSQALGLLVLGGIWLGANLVIFQVLQKGSGISETALLFELISAFATVGLSLDLTPSITDGGKMLLIMNMFVGRIGLLTVMATLVRPDPRPASGRPTEEILLT